MKTILKYEINTGINEIDLPRGARILHVKVEHGAVYIYAEVNIYTNKEVETRIFKTYSLGEEMSEHENVYYVGDFCYSYPGSLFHLYEIIK